MNGACTITRYWLDDNGPHAEVAQIQAHPLGIEIDVSRIEGEASGPVPHGPLAVVAVAAPAVDAGLLAQNLSALYALPLRPGARLVDRATFETATAEQAAADEAALADIAAHLAAQHQASQDARMAEAVTRWMSEHGPGTES